MRYHLDSLMCMILWLGCCIWVNATPRRQYVYQYHKGSYEWVSAVPVTLYEWGKATPIGQHDELAAIEHWFGWPMFCLETMRHIPKLWMKDGEEFYREGAEYYVIHKVGLAVNCILALVAMVLVGMAVEYRIWLRFLRLDSLTWMILWLGVCILVNATTIRRYDDDFYRGRGFDRGFGWPMDFLVTKWYCSEDQRYEHYELDWVGLAVNGAVASLSMGLVGLVIERRPWLRIFRRGAPCSKIPAPEGNGRASVNNAAGRAREGSRARDDDDP